jgi:hypothetical protein
MIEMERNGQRSEIAEVSVEVVIVKVRGVEINAEVWDEEIHQMVLERVCEGFRHRRRCQNQNPMNQRKWICVGWKLLMFQRCEGLALWKYQWCEELEQMQREDLRAEKCCFAEEWE